ncbi:MAG: hypothetical protein WCJ09_03885 [Planctomycetota bacterium]
MVNNSSVALNRRIHRTIIGVWCSLVIVAGAAWILPIEVAQAWAVDRVPNDEFLRYEASSAATASVWLLRCVASIGFLAVSLVWWKQRTAIPFFGCLVKQFWQVTAPPGAGFIVATTCRLMVLAWIGLAVVHGGLSLQRRLWEWPVYRLLPGRTILPNISDSNRDVIRYVSLMTPPGSRIFVVSDQKLYFLSYYLLPRRIYHVTHPDSEFVIAQADNQRQLAAYRVQYLSPDQIDRLKPDYLLHYFEGAQYVKGEDLLQDSNWIEYQQRKHGPTWRPQYLVSLQRYSSRQSP